MKDIMVDLETLGTGYDAAIISIGAVFMDLENEALGDRFHVNIDFDSAIKSGGSVTGNTVAWWFGQSAEARTMVMSDAMSVESALYKFNQFVSRSSGVTRVWGNGATFDNVVLRSAFNRAGIKPNWSFRHDRCYRTMKAFTRVEEPEFVGIPHNALHDAMHQAKYLLEMVKELKHGS